MIDIEEELTRPLSPNMSVTFKKAAVAMLAIIIIAAYSIASYHYLFPKKSSMNKEDQKMIEFVITNNCPHNQTIYNQLLQDDGTILTDDAEYLLMECTKEIKADLFYETLVREFSKHYE